MQRLQLSLSVMRAPRWRKLRTCAQSHFATRVIVEGQRKWHVQDVRVTAFRYVQDLLNNAV